MQSTPSLEPKALLFSFILSLVFLLASCSQHPIPQSKDDLELPTLFTDADIDEAELQLASKIAALQGVDEDSIPEAMPLQDLFTLDTDLTTQAVLANTFGFVYYIEHNPNSTTQPFSLFRHDQNSDVATRIYAGLRDIQAVSGTIDGNTVFVSMRETVSSSDFEIFRLRINPARVQRLTSNSVDDTNVSVSGNGLRAVWEQPLAGKATIIMRTYIDLGTTSNFFEVSLNRSEEQRQPSLSSNGQFIVLVRELTNGRSGVIRFDVQTSSYLTIATSSAILEHPSITSAGTKILYLQKVTTGNDVVRLRDLVAGTTQTVAGSATIEHPFLSADGRHVTFGSLQSGALRVFVKNILTGQQLPLTTPASPINHKGMSWAMPLAGDTRLTSPSTLSARGGFGASVAADGNTIVVAAEGELQVAGSDTSVIGAVYVYQRDLTGQWLLSQRIVQLVKNALFGSSVALSGNFMVIGARSEGADINGNGRIDSDEVGVGAAYIYQRPTNTSTWSLVKKVLDPDRARFDAFGNSVAVSGTTVLVGAPNDDTKGSVLIFEKDLGGSNNWGFVKKITGSDTLTGDSFGEVMASSGGTVVVGAGGNNNQQGAAYVFERNQGGANNWGEVKKLTASDGKAGSAGFNPANRQMAVAISGSTIVMGTSNEARDVDGIPGIGLNDFAVGSAYIFERNQGGSNAWGEVKKLVSSTPAAFDFYGTSVAIRGDLIIVGVPRGTFNIVTIGGSAFLYQRNVGGSNNWGETAQLTPGDANSRQRDDFGTSSVITGTGIVVGAPSKDSIVGAAYVFE